jgi:hypothetical protein
MRSRDRSGPEDSRRMTSGADDVEHESLGCDEILDDATPLGLLGSRGRGGYGSRAIQAMCHELAQCSPHLGRVGLLNVVTARGEA